MESFAHDCVSLDASAACMLPQVLSRDCSFASTMQGRALLLVGALALAGAAKKKGGGAVIDPDCVVTSTSVDGTEETRDCYMITASEMTPGTKGRFESCTQ